MININHEHRKTLMNEKINCQLLGKKSIKISHTPYPGKLGIYIQQHYCEQAWQNWLAAQTKLINEYQLNPLDKEHRKLLEKEMINFFKIDKSKIDNP